MFVYSKPDTNQRKPKRKPTKSCQAKQRWCQHTHTHAHGHTHTSPSEARRNGDQCSYILNLIQITDNHKMMEMKMRMMMKMVLMMMTMVMMMTMMMMMYSCGIFLRNIPAAYSCRIFLRNTHEKYSCGIFLRNIPAERTLSQSHTGRVWSARLGVESPRQNLQTILEINTNTQQKPNKKRPMAGPVAARGIMRISFNRDNKIQKKTKKHRFRIFRCFARTRINIRIN